MQHLFTPEGEAGLAAILRKRPLLAFDFDGTLAPIVARPDDARISRRAAARLGSLAARLPVAIVTGLAPQALAIRVLTPPAARSLMFFRESTVGYSLLPAPMTPELLQRMFVKRTALAFLR